MATLCNNVPQLFKIVCSLLKTKQTVMGDIVFNWNVAKHIEFFSGYLLTRLLFWLTFGSQCQPAWFVYQWEGLYCLDSSVEGIGRHFETVTIAHFQQLVSSVFWCQFSKGECATTKLTMSLIFALKNMFMDPNRWLKSQNATHFCIRTECVNHSLQVSKWPLLMCDDALCTLCTIPISIDDILHSLLRVAFIGDHWRSLLLRNSHIRFKNCKIVFFFFNGLN